MSEPNAEYERRQGKHSRFCSKSGPKPCDCETWPDTFAEMFPNLPGAEELDRLHPPAPIDGSGA